MTIPTLVQKMDAPVLVHPTARKWATRIVFVLCLMVTAGSYSQFIAKENRVAAAAEKPVIQQLVDDTATFGRVEVDEHGVIKRWTRGMTVITGWNSKDMVGQTAERLSPGTSDADATTFMRVFSRRELPWSSYGFMRIKVRNGEVIIVRVSVRDLDGHPLYREISIDTGRRVDVLKPQEQDQ